MFYYRLENEDTKKISAWTDNAEQAKLEHLQQQTDKKPVQIWNGDWYLQGYVPKKQDELLAKEKRESRDSLLRDSDLRMLPDYPITEEEKGLWIKYRQYLRDLPERADFPNVEVLNFEDWNK
mgnify:CR=1 FL=1